MADVLLGLHNLIARKILRFQSETQILRKIEWENKELHV